MQKHLQEKLDSLLEEIGRLKAENSMLKAELDGKSTEKKPVLKPKLKKESPEEKQPSLF